MYIENINGPEDVKKLSEDQLNVLAEEIRDALLKKLSKHGGHFGPNFGMVEATIAMHYVCLLYTSISAVTICLSMEDRNRLL